MLGTYCWCLLKENQVKKQNKKNKAEMNISLTQFENTFWTPKYQHPVRKNAFSGVTASKKCRCKYAKVRSVDLNHVLRGPYAVFIDESK